MFNYLSLLLFPLIIDGSLAVEQALSDENLCLVSQLIIKNTKNESDVHPYPEFYFSNMQSVTPNFPEKNLYRNCSNIYEVEGNEKDSLKELLKSNGKKNCVFGVCPLVHENIALSWNIVDWNFSADAICKLGKHLRTHSQPASESKVKVNVIVFGGKRKKHPSVFITIIFNVLIITRFDNRWNWCNRSMLHVLIHVM